MLFTSASTVSLLFYITQMVLFSLLSISFVFRGYSKVYFKQEKLCQMFADVDFKCGLKKLSEGNRWQLNLSKSNELQLLIDKDKRYEVEDI